jgi:hypothetical protein
MLERFRQDTKRLTKGVSRRVVPARWRVHWDLRDEKRMLDGRLLIPEAGPQSVVFFTVHKCASTFTARSVAYLATEKLGLRHINMARYFWRMETGDAYDHIQERAGGLFHPYGFLYGPLRQPVDVPEIDRYRTVLMLRDPRDVLTSFYYSITVSHGVPGTRDARDQFLEVRKRWEGSTVDEFVLGWLPEFQKRYEGYIRLRAQTDCPVLKYEDMLVDFDKWAGDLGDAFGVTLTDEDVENLRSMGGFDREVSESASRHIRQRKPGDHVRKLMPETVEQITDRLLPVLKGFGYL